MPCSFLHKCYGCHNYLCFLILRFTNHKLFPSGLRYLSTIQHVNTVHLKKKPHKCAICLDYRVGQRSHLVRHYKKNHSNQPIPPHPQCNNFSSRRTPRNARTTIAGTTRTQVEPTRKNTAGSRHRVTRRGLRSPSRVGSVGNRRERRKIVLKLRLKSNEQEN